MKIGLIDLDRSEFPNLPLMKISAFHKLKGDFVEWYDPLFSDHMDIVYIAKVFTWTSDYNYNIDSEKIIKGGIGYGIGNDNPLPYEIEHIYPDYELYKTNKAYGFLTRGCPRNCKYCNVTNHQGNISRKVSNLNEFWKNQKEIVLLDPNIFACQEWENLFIQLLKSSANIDFTQGLDIRLIDKNKVDYLNKLNIKMIHFAWDQYDLKVYEKLKEYRNELIYTDRKLRVYVLVNYNTNFNQDLDRVNKLRLLKYDPYIMIYDKKQCGSEYKRLQRWVNNKYIFRSVDNYYEYKNMNSNNNNLFYTDLQKF